MSEPMHFDVLPPVAALLPQPEERTGPPRASPAPERSGARLTAPAPAPRALSPVPAPERAPQGRSLATAWAETLGLALLYPVAAAAAGGRDLFASAGTFPWIALAPVLAGLRYGSAYGLGCGAVLTAEILLAGHLHLGGVQGFPAGLVIGLFALGLVAGEFRDLWERRLGQLRAEAEARRVHLEELARAHQVLQASQSRLEQHLSTGRAFSSLYRSVNAALARPAHPRAPLMGWGTQVLDLLAAHCHVQIARVHPITADGSLGAACAALGGAEMEPAREDRVIAEALRQRKLVTATETRTPAKVLAAVPFVDCDGRVWGLAAIGEMPFEGFEAENLQLLALLGGVIGDRIAACAVSRGRGTAAAGLGHLLRRVGRLRALGVRSTVVGLAASGPAASAVFGLLEKHARAGDEVWIVDEGGARAALVLLTQANRDGAKRYLSRLNQACLAATLMDLDAMGVSPILEELGAETPDEKVVARVANEMGLADLGRRGRSAPLRARDLRGVLPS